MSCGRISRRTPGASACQSVKAAGPTSTGSGAGGRDQQGGEESARDVASHGGLTRTHAQDMRNREGELRPVQRVEMELVHPVRAQQPHLLGGYHGGDQAAESPSCSVPSNMPASQPGTLAPHMALNFAAWAKFVTGMMPGTIGAVMPAARQRSRKRR